MLTHIHPKLPMRKKSVTRDFYTDQLGFRVFGTADYDDYLMMERDRVQIHFFAFPDLNPRKNYGQIYLRVEEIDTIYASLLKKGTPIHPNGKLADKPWGLKEFALLDPDSNLLTFGEQIHTKD
ncbi:bleomycin resistance protein [Croceiramulus getboli]|nr:VOC family protein [Flavobacteriaceae bacterium YJPT1-3]